MNKWMKVGLFAVGAMLIVPRILPGVTPQAAAAIGAGVAGGGIIGVGAAYFGSRYVPQIGGGTAGAGTTFY